MDHENESIISAIEADDVGALGQLLGNGVSPDAMIVDGRTLLHVAAEKEALASLLLLIESGAEVDARDALGRTALYVATAANVHAGEMIMALRGAGANPFARTFSGSSPYELAHLWDDEVAHYFSDLPIPDASGEIAQLAPNVHCFATRWVALDHAKVGVMTRDQDGVWFFMAGSETQTDVDNPANTAVYSLQTIADVDVAIVPFLDAPVGSYLVRQDDGRFAPQ